MFLGEWFPLGGAGGCQKRVIAGRVKVIDDVSRKRLFFCSNFLSLCKTLDFEEENNFCHLRVCSPLLDLTRAFVKQMSYFNS